MTDINLSLQIEVVINIFSIVICSAMIIYFVVLAALFNVTLLDYDYYNYYMFGKIRFDNGTTGRVYWVESSYDYDADIFVAMMVCLFGWVS